MVSFDEILSKQTIFSDASVLSPHFVPKELPFRDEQISEIMTVISPALKARKPKNLIVYGKTGTGKTVSIKRIMEEFDKQEKDAAIVYLNCRIYNSRYRILQKVLKGFVPQLEKSGFGLPFLYEKMIEVTNKGKQIVVVLDEIDMVKDLDDLVYTLTRANDEMNSGGVSIIGVSNKLSFKDALDPRSKSSLHETEMVFPPYTSNQLQEILSQRVAVGFKEDVVDSSAINLTAAITAQESGDARYALKLMLKAGELAEQNEGKKVTDKEVEDARHAVELDLAAETINTLPENHQIVLYAIAKISMSGSKYSRLEGMDDTFLFSGEIYEKYESLCKKMRKRPRTLRWYKEYLNDLEMLGLITTTPSSKGIRGHTTLIKIGQSPRDIEKIIRDNLEIEL
jgi:cell division control protein 6